MIDDHDRIQKLKVFANGGNHHQKQLRMFIKEIIDDQKQIRNGLKKIKDKSRQIEEESRRIQDETVRFKINIKSLNTLLDEFEKRLSQKTCI